jgi:hypothetical protein
LNETKDVTDNNFNGLNNTINDNNILSKRVVKNISKFKTN